MICSILPSGAETNSVNKKKNTDFFFFLIKILSISYVFADKGLSMTDHDNIVKLDLHT